MRVNCICCNILLEIDEPGDPVNIFPVYGGLIFRSTGNYGSTVFDPMVLKNKEMLQIIICDQCIRKKKRSIVRLYDIKERITAKSKEFKYDD